MNAWDALWLVPLAAFVFLVVYDLLQNDHAILKNFPVVGHFRYWLETVGPELRQYIVTNNDEERPFSRDQRRCVYTSSKRGNTYFGFGTDNVEWVDADEQGRIRTDLVPELDASTILVLQAGNVNSGAFDDFNSLCPKATRVGAWVVFQCGARSVIQLSLSETSQRITQG